MIFQNELILIYLHLDKFLENLQNSEAVSQLPLFGGIFPHAHQLLRREIKI